MKIALLCSAGGHLTEIKQLEALYTKYDHFFVTFNRADSRELTKAHFLTDPKRSPFKTLRTLIESARIFLKEKPDVLITTGAGVVIPFCWIAKLFGKKIIYIESFCRTSKPSLTGRLLYPITDLFLVQWEQLLGKYGNKARFWGRLV